MLQAVQCCRSKLQLVRGGMAGRPVGSIRLCNVRAALEQNLGSLRPTWEGGPGPSRASQSCTVSVNPSSCPALGVNAVSTSATLRLLPLHLGGCDLLLRGAASPAAASHAGAAASWLPLLRAGACWWLPVLLPLDASGVLAASRCCPLTSASQVGRGGCPALPLQRRGGFTLQAGNRE